jgi:lipopolysaccharide assembly protein A
VGSGLRTGMIAGLAVLILVVIFIIQNTHAVNISFPGAHLHLSLAVALILAAIADALLMAAAGTHGSPSCGEPCATAGARPRPATSRAEPSAARPGSKQHVSGNELC